MPGSFDFDIAWNTPDKAVPTDWSSWPGSGADLTIQRVELSPLFRRVVLNPLDTKNHGSFAIENGGVSSPTHFLAGISNAWYLRGTVLALYDTNQAPGTFQLQTKVVVQADTSFVFEDGTWQSGLSGWGTNSPGAPTTSLNQFTSLATSMALSPMNPQVNTSNGDSTSTAVMRFYNFMLDYNAWASQGFPKNGNTWNAVRGDQAALANLTTLMSN